MLRSDLLFSPFITNKWIRFHHTTNNHQRAVVYKTTSHRFRTSCEAFGLLRPDGCGFVCGLFREGWLILKTVRSSIVVLCFVYKSSRRTYDSCPELLSVLKPFFWDRILLSGTNHLELESTLICSGKRIYGTRYLYLWYSTSNLGLYILRQSSSHISSRSMTGRLIQQVHMIPVVCRFNTLLHDLFTAAPLLPQETTSIQHSFVLQYIVAYIPCGVQHNLASFVTACHDSVEMSVLS